MKLSQKKILKKDSLASRISTGQRWLGLELKKTKNTWFNPLQDLECNQRFRWSLGHSKERNKRPQHLANSNTPKPKDWKAKTSWEKGGKGGIDPWMKLVQKKALIKSKGKITKVDYSLPPFIHPLSGKPRPKRWLILTKPSLSLAWITWLKFALA